jgi:GT2 family glycosyltransferase
MSRKRSKPTPKTLVDVIIPVLNRFDILYECLQCLPDAFGSIPYHVYIYDNGSERLDADNFYEANQAENISVFRSMQNHGFPIACNTSFRKGRSPLVFFLNSDVLLHPNSGDLLVRAMDDPKTGVIGMKLVFPTEEQLVKAGLNMGIRPAQKLQHIGIMSNIKGQFGHIFVGWSADHPKVNAVSDVLGVTGAALMTRRMLFSQAGMFWTGYGAGTYEDLDYCLTIKEMGYNVKVEPKAVGVHYTGATAETHKLGFPMRENYQKFMLRWRDKLVQTDIDVL